MYYRTLAKGLAQFCLATATTTGGIAGTLKGFDIAEDNRCPRYSDLSSANKFGENVCSFMIITGCTFIGTVVTPPLVITSPFWYPSASKDVKDFFTIKRRK